MFWTIDYILITARKKWEPYNVKTSGNQTKSSTVTQTINCAMRAMISALMVIQMNKTADYLTANLPSKLPATHVPRML